MYDIKDRLPPAWLTITLWKSYDPPDTPLDNKGKLTDDECDLIIQMYQEGETYPRIADALYVTESRIKYLIQCQILGKLQARRDRERKGWQPTDQEVRLACLRNKGYKYSELAELFGWSETTLKGRIEKLMKKGLIKRRFHSGSGNEIDWARGDDGTNC